MPLCTNGANRLSGESDNDVESVNNNEFIGCLFNQSELKKDAVAKRIEGFLSAVSAKKINDNSFADAALKKLFVQYNTSLPSSAALERLFISVGQRKLKLYSSTANSAKSNGYSATANPQACGTFAVIFALPQLQMACYFCKLESQTLLFFFLVW